MYNHIPYHINLNPTDKKTGLKILLKKLGLARQAYLSANIVFSNDKYGYPGKVRVMPDTNPQQAWQIQDQAPTSPLLFTAAVE